MNYQTTSRQMPIPLSSVLKSMSIANPSSEKFKTGQNPKDQNTQIGKPLSETALAALRNQADQAKRGIMVSDESLLQSLKQVLGSRLATKKKYQPVYNRPGGYDEDFTGYAVSLDALHDSEMKLFDAIEFFNRPVDPHQVADITSMVTRMRVSLLRKAEDNNDAEMLVDTAIGVLSRYPFDIVMGLTNEWLTKRKFFPLPYEMVAELDLAVSLRRSLLSTFERIRNPLRLA